MCGRFSLSTGLTTLKEQFQFIYTDEMKPRYNIAPSQFIITVVQKDNDRVGKQMRWGLIPFWAKDIKIGYKMINARAETINEKPSYKYPFQRQRCLILADGYKAAFPFLALKGHSPFQAICRKVGIFVFAPPFSVQ
jgi:putative SOS response-associated peptidase YedK